MKGLQFLRSIIVSMSTDERRVCIAYLKAFDIRKSKASQQSVTLFNLLTPSDDNEDPLKDDEIEFLIYNKKNSDAFGKLIIRLKEKIMDAMLININLERYGSLSERDRALIECKKKLSFGQILGSRKLEHIADFYYSEVIEIAKEFELFDDLVSALFYRLPIRVNLHGEQEYKRHIALINHYNFCRDGLQKAQLLYNELACSVEFQINSESNNTYLVQKISELKKINKAAKTASIEFYCNYVETHHLQINKQFSFATSILRKQRKLIEEHKAVRGNNRIVSVLTNIAENEICQHNFSFASKICDQGFLKLSDINFNYYQLVEHKFYCLYYQGYYEKAKELLNTRYKKEKIKSPSPFQEGRRKYFLACSEFMLGNMDAVYQILSEINPIERDKSGWNIGIRILMIMTDIEISNLRSADQRIIVSARHLLKLQGQSESTLKRENSIQFVLQCLERNAFDFKQTRHECWDILNAMEKGDEDMRWRPLSSELVIFHNWFKDKSLRVSNNNKQTIPPYKEDVWMVLSTG
jgi:hypothetical protein